MTQYLTLIDLEQGRPLVIRFVKQGNKYVHGIPCHQNDEGIVEEAYWTGKWDLNKYNILEGARWDLCKKYQTYRSQVQAHEDERKQARWSFESQAQKQVLDKMTLWDKEHPAP